MAEINNKIAVKWYVIFCRAKKDSGIMRWLDRDINHVYAMKKSAGGQFWQIINPLVGYVDVSMVLVSDYPHPVSYAGNAIVLPVTAYVDNESRATLCIFNCVEVIKGLLGIRSFWTFTPYQLYKYLRRL